MVEHQMLKKPELRMARAVQGWLQTIRLGEQFQTELKMSMAKLQPKRIYWFVYRNILDASVHSETLNELFYFYSGRRKRIHNDPTYGLQSGRNIPDRIIT